MKKQQYAKEEVVKLLKEMVKIPSVNPAYDSVNADYAGEFLIASFLKAWFKKRGLSCKLTFVEKRRPNLEILSGKSRPHLLLCSHMDTIGIKNMVTDPFLPICKKGRLYGRGCLDAKGMLAMMIFAFLACINRGILKEGTLSLLFVCDEEHEGKGVSEFIKRSVLPDASIIGEPTNLKIGIAQTGGFKFKMKLHGTATHGCTPQAGADANLAMAKIISNIDKFIKRRFHPLIGYASTNVGLIQGGTHASVVSDICEVDIDCRTLPDERGKKIYYDFKKFIKDQKIPKGIRIEITPPYIGPIDGFETDSKAPIVEALKEAVETRTDLVGLPYGSDGHYLAKAGVPTVIFGPGRIEEAHTADESIEIDALFNGINILIKGIANYFNSHPS